MGQMAVEQAYRILAGEQPEPLLQLPTKLFTRENGATEVFEAWE